MSVAPEPQPGTRREMLFRQLACLRELPPAPRTMTAIWEVLDRPTSTARALSDVLQQDAALSARVLRLANSAYFGLPRPASDVRAACVLLGFDSVRAMAIGVSTLDALSAGVKQALDLDRFWRHSLGAATAAQLLARHAGISDAGGAFCAGILHDVGKLVLATLSSERYRALDTGGPADLAAEVRIFGADHGEVGGWLAARWHFPGHIQESIRSHHEDPAKMGRFASLVHVADRLAHRAAPDGQDAAERPEPAAGAIARLGLDQEALRLVEAGLAAARERVDAFAEAARSAA